MSDIVSAALANENIGPSDVTETNQQPEVLENIPTENKGVEKDAAEAESNISPKTVPDNTDNQTDTSPQDAENQIAAVLTEMQNSNSESTAVVEKTEESNQNNFEPSIAVIMQDESTPSVQENPPNQGQVQLTQDQLDVMQSGQIPSQASLYTLGNIVLILSPEVMASGGLTQEQIQQIQESQANAIAQDGSSININLGGLQSALASNAATVVNPVQPPAPATTAPKESNPPTKKPEEGKEKEKRDDQKSPKDIAKDKQALPKTTAASTTTIPSNTTKDKTAPMEKKGDSETATTPAEKPDKDKTNGEKETSTEKGKKSSDQDKTEKENKGKKDEKTNKPSPEDAAKRPFKCVNCGDSYEKKEQLDAHVKTHNRRKRGRQPMRVSPEPESKPTRSKRSKQGKTTEGDGEKTEDDPLQCEVCGDTFSAELKLRKHLTTHNVNKRLHCDGCKVPFAFQYQLDRHIRRNTGDQPYKCDQCEDSFTLRCHFNYHLRLHNPKKTHACDHCGKTFNSFANLKGHIRIHTGEKPYKCDMCEKCFTEYSSLAKHKRAHTGEKPFKCTHCDKAFSQSGGLKVHLRTHTGERPFKCTECDRAFAKGYNLKTHMRTHTGEKPYKCEICSKPFSQHSTLVTHVRRHEGKTLKTKMSTAQQTTGNPEMDIVESHPVTTDTSVITEQQVQPQAAAPQVTTEAQAEPQAALQTEPQAIPQPIEEEPKTIQAATLESIPQEGTPIIVTETVLSEKTEAEEMADIQEASQAIQMLQMQQLVNQVEEVVAQAAAAASYSS